MSWRHDAAHHNWREIDRRVLAYTPIFTVASTRRMDSEQNSGEFVLIEAPEWVTIIPLIETSDGDREFLMVRQYRHGSGNITVEFPAGAVEEGEDPAVAAARELREETGHEAGKLIHLGTVNPNPAFMTNRTHTYLALNLEKVAEQSLDIHERVEFASIGERTVFDRMGTGEYNNGVMMMSLGFYRRWLESSK